MFGTPHFVHVGLSIKLISLMFSILLAESIIWCSILEYYFSSLVEVFIVFLCRICFVHICAYVLSFLLIYRKNMRHLGLSAVLKRGHKRQRTYTMRFQVDGVRNPPSTVTELALLSFMRNPLLLLTPLVPYTLPRHIPSCNRTRINSAATWWAEEVGWRSEATIWWGNETHS